MLHLAVVWQNRRGDAFEFFIAADLHEHPQKLRAQAVVLTLVAYGQGELGFVRSMQLAQASHAEDFRLAVFGVAALDYKHHLAIVVDEADAAKALVGDALVEFQRREVAEVNAAFRKSLVKLHHQRLVFGSNGSDQDRRAVLQFPSSYISGRIRTDGELGKFFFAHIRAV